jgi:hypothetical protein
MIPLCKAKTLGGDWVEGYVIYDQYTQECEIMRAIKKDAPDSLDRATIWLWDKVHPSTVCLWTGKTDMNGVKIFEVDRVKVKIGLDDEEYTVFWHVEKCQFMLVDNENVCAKFNDIPAEICEVIGSIHDKEGER